MICSQEVTFSKLVGGLVAIFYFPIYLECHHPNWLIFFRTGWPWPTNQKTKDSLILEHWKRPCCDFHRGRGFRWLRSAWAESSAGCDSHLMLVKQCHKPSPSTVFRAGIHIETYRNRGPRAGLWPCCSHITSIYHCSPQLFYQPLQFARIVPSSMVRQLILADTVKHVA